VTPEFLTNYEFGIHFKPTSKISVEASIYYSRGRDFQYSIGTGDSIDTGGNSLKPVIITDNVAKISVKGLEISAQYALSKQLFAQLCYSYNHSVIDSYHPLLVNPELDLSGKMMVEVPPQLFYAGINWTNRFISLQANCSFTDKQWFDVENTIQINSWFITNIRLSHTFSQKTEIYLDIQDLFDNVYIDRKGQLSPGRFILAGFKYSIHK